MVKTVCVIAVVCTLPFSGYAGRAMTSEQLKAFPEDLRTEGVKNPEPFREKIEKTRQIFSARETETQEDFSGE